MNFELIVERMVIEDFAKKVLEHQVLPSFLFLEQKYKRLVIGMSQNNDPIGMAYGVIEHGTDRFFLHYMYIKKEYRVYENVRALLHSIFMAAINTRRINHAMWNFITDDNAEINAHIQLLTSIPYCNVRDVQSSKQFRIKTSDFSHLRKFKIFNPKLWVNRGYGVQKLSECNVTLKDKMRSKDTSPFSYQKKHSLRIDERNSYVFTRNNMQEPMGWILCRLISENEIMIQHFYMYETERAKMVAHSFAAHVFNLIALSFEYLWFDVAQGNRQMEMIVKNYFEPIIDFNRINYNLMVDFAKVNCCYTQNCE
ncbi:MAG: hypothetical protein FWE05_04040 [Defluviitaleaceae bacterium]|nr:hypothetical protein [Defluviitaleaceae bacterium]